MTSDSTANKDIVLGQEEDDKALAALVTSWVVADVRQRLPLWQTCVHRATPCCVVSTRQSEGDAWGCKCFYVVHVREGAEVTSAWLRDMRAALGRIKEEVSQGRTATPAQDYVCLVDNAGQITYYEAEFATRAASS